MKTLRLGLLLAAFSLAAFGQVSINANPNLVGAAVGQPYSVNLYPAGGTAPYTFTLLSGSLPPGLALSSGGVISGTPSTAGTYNFTVMAADSAGASAVASFTLPVSAQPLTLSPTPSGGTLPAAQVGIPYLQKFTASGGTGPYTYLLVLPNPQSNPLDLDRTTGVFTGTPAYAGLFPFTVEVIDANQRIVSQSYILTIQPQAPLAIGPPCNPLPSITPGVPMTFNSPPWAAPRLTRSRQWCPTGLSSPRWLSAWHPESGFGFKQHV